MQVLWLHQRNGDERREVKPLLLLLLLAFLAFLWPRSRPIEPDEPALFV
jgi:hypothetical protein